MNGEKESIANPAGDGATTQGKGGTKSDLYLVMVIILILALQLATDNTTTLHQLTLTFLVLVASFLKRCTHENILGEVHHNCTKGESNYYGLGVYGSSSSIQLVFPLTKEQVATDNGGGGNWGAVDGGDTNQIRTIDAPAISSSSAAQADETKSID